MDNAILNKLMNLLISLARDVVVPPRPLDQDHYTRCESTMIASIGNFNVQMTIKPFAFTVQWL